MNKVDASRAAGIFASKYPRWHPDFDVEPVTRPSYNREPYVRVRMEMEAVNGKAIAWTRNYVQVKWQDHDLSVEIRWVPASWVKRISRDESIWRDPYDIVD
ncbi:hypothetical protein LVY72_12365 [Arthrobacter sp. I2-34]|uniref:Transposase n=1 Tax=Arthrobacter hankyongi TaxID=2904801 RepID=A0ABS9L7P1_9MICC|nr:hypothetical protein [Arthrobacter hankyongi]MCG2622697.1 hypothetical protein [Arthrobacter hankyongi]